VHGVQLCRRTSSTHSALPMPFPAKLELLRLVLPINQHTTSSEAQTLSSPTLLLLTTRPCFSFYHGTIWQMSTGGSGRKQSNSTMHMQPAVELYVQISSTQKLKVNRKYLAADLYFNSVVNWLLTFCLTILSYYLRSHTYSY